MTRRRLRLRSDATRYAREVFAAEAANLGVVAARQDGAERLVLAGDEDEARTAEAELGAVALEHAEEAVVVAAWAVDADLVEAAHVAVHGFPLAAAAEHGRRGVGDGLDHRNDLRGDLGGAAV